ncbi:Mu transposase C-terminal domain-containing protein [Cellulomonas humilata]|uniref:Mu transposase C-terminal domain-containing protein n=1 Tax=Cellulomonas humilata TaxID=144055 RepID=UPI001B35663C
MVLEIGRTVLVDDGPAVVTSLHVAGVTVRVLDGSSRVVEWPDLDQLREPNRADAGAVIRRLQPLWSCMSEAGKETTLDRLEVVLEIVTGFRRGHAELADGGEPREPFGPAWGVSLTTRCTRMAALLTDELQNDRGHRRRLDAGSSRRTSVSASTVYNWVVRWRQDGLVGLVDARQLRGRVPFDVVLSTEFRSAAALVVGQLDGSTSTVNIDELMRRIRVRMLAVGLDEPVPQRASLQYLSQLMRERGHTTRSQRTRSLRGTTGYSHVPVVRIGEVVAIDATRADVLVYDERSGKPISVEILTAIDVASRVVLALRVVARSADSVDASLLMYDVMRPMSQLVEGTTYRDWRWAGIPEGIAPPFTPAVWNSLEDATLQGEHPIPGLTPDAIRSDHGSIFVSAAFEDVLRKFQIDLLLSRGKRPTDNAHVERWHETLQRAVQQLPGYKGRNPSQRGSATGRIDAGAIEPLVTATELQRHLRAFVALDYHRTWHQGLVYPGVELERLTPLSLFDALHAVTGRIHVPQDPDLLYEFLPVRWGTVGGSGVEFHNLTYDAPVLDGFRAVRSGEFRRQDSAVPFFYDPHDVSRIWFRDPATGTVVEVPWRGAHLLSAPMTDATRDRAIGRIRAQRGAGMLKRGAATELIARELGALSTNAGLKEWRAQLAAAQLRVEQSRRDHDEAQAAIAEAASLDNPAPGTSDFVALPEDSAGLSVYRDDEWPDLREL